MSARSIIAMRAMRFSCPDFVLPARRYHRLADRASREPGSLGAWRSPAPDYPSKNSNDPSNIFKGRAADAPLRIALQRQLHHLVGDRSHGTHVIRDRIIEGF